MLLDGNVVGTLFNASACTSDFDGAGPGPWGGSCPAALEGREAAGGRRAARSLNPVSGLRPARHRVREGRRTGQSGRLRGTASSVPVIAGVRVPREQALALAALLTREGSDHAARILLAAVTSGQEFVALTLDEREAVLAVLDHPPAELVELRSALFAELTWRRNGLTPPRRGTRFPLHVD